jgi:hypothetical protein
MLVWGLDIGRADVRVGGCEHEEGCKSPNFQVESILEIRAEFEGFGKSIVSVVLDTSNNECRFPFIQEFPRARCFLWKIDNEEVAGNAEYAGYETLDLQEPLAIIKFVGIIQTYDKDPAPSGEPSKPVHLHDAIGHDARNS